MTEPVITIPSNREPPMNGAPTQRALLDGHRVALVHDWLTGMRGGEKVLEALSELLPDAEIFTLLHDQGTVSPRIEATCHHRSFIQYLPKARHRYREYLPLFPIAIEQFDLDGFDLVISTSHCAAKSVVRTGRARHLCYCFTPMRYAWDQFDSYFGPARVGRLKSRLYRFALRRLARWDADTSHRVDRYVAISQHVARRIGRYYNRVASVVYPPVDTKFFHPNGSATGSYFLIVSALVPYKRIDLAIDACARAQVPLRIIGAGPELSYLQERADSTVEFLGVCTDTEIRDLYRGALAVLLPGEEDFGIAPVEAQACGRPVIALARGGVIETVRHGKTGFLVDESSPEAFTLALRRAIDNPLDPDAIRQNALRFSRKRYLSEMSRCIMETVMAKKGMARW